eukprot:2812736-Ditylum_brightwellii.AAC.1
MEYKLLFDLAYGEDIPGTIHATMDVLEAEMKGQYKGDILGFEKEENVVCTYEMYVTHNSA